MSTSYFLHRVIIFSLGLISLPFFARSQTKNSNKCYCKNLEFDSLIINKKENLFIYDFHDNKEHYYIFVDSNQQNSKEINITYATLELVKGRKYSIQLCELIAYPELSGIIIDDGRRGREGVFNGNNSGYCYSTCDIQNGKIIKRKKRKCREFSSRKSVRF